MIIGLNSAGASYDHRGDIYNDDYNCAMFMAYTPPNSKIPDPWGATRTLPLVQLRPGDESPLQRQQPVFQRRPEPPPGRGQHPPRRRQRQVRQGLDQRRHLGVPSAARNGGEVISGDSY